MERHLTKNGVWRSAKHRPSSLKSAEVQPANLCFLFFGVHLKKAQLPISFGSLSSASLHARQRFLHHRSRMQASRKYNRVRVNNGSSLYSYVTSGCLVRTGLAPIMYILYTNSLKRLRMSILEFTVTTQKCTQWSIRKQKRLFTRYQ